jgi:cytochrome c553
MSAPDLLRALRACLLLAAAGAVLPGHAQDPAQAQGSQITTQGAGPAVPACATCHGAHGEGGPAFPRLAGTGQAYLQAQLEAFASGARKNPLMQPIAQGLTPQQRAAVTLYYSKLPAPLHAADAQSARPEDAGAWLATRGRWANQVPACVQCHGPGGNGVGATFPPLAGLPAAYITAQLQAWKGGARPPGPLSLMATVASKLTDADVSAVSAYYAGLGATASVPVAAGAKPKVTP